MSHDSPSTPVPPATLVVDRRKEVSGKSRCDRCRKDAPPIHECRVNQGGTDHWADLCAECIGAIEHAQSPKTQTAFRERILFPGCSLGPSTPYRGQSEFNVYGPRPANGGFRCTVCHTEEGPLFGVDEHQKPADNRSWCSRCLRKAHPSGGTINPTPDAAKALGLPGLPNNNSATARPAPSAEEDGTRPQKAAVAAFQKRRKA